ncbi:hypothetical protein ACJX0J_020351, partial [Zea mays]
MKTQEMTMLLVLETLMLSSDCLLEYIDAAPCCSSTRFYEENKLHCTSWSVQPSGHSARIGILGHKKNFTMLQGVEQFRSALEMAPCNHSAYFGLASALLAWARNCVATGAFGWAASLSKVFVIDYGLVNKYRDLQNHKHIPY